MSLMRVNEVFYSLQGEGRRAGEPSIFIRVAGCSMSAACLASGVLCDTEFASGTDYTPEALLAAVRAASSDCRWIVWTGGEPTDRLSNTIVELFKTAGYLQAIETSGVRPVSPGLDWVTVSPKVAEHALVRNFTGQRVDELKYVRRMGQGIPVPALTASHYYLQPHALGQQVDMESLRHCIELCKTNPQWSLSLQTHKLLGIR